LNYLIFILVFSSFFSASFLNMNVGFAQLTVFRMALFIIILITFIKAINSKNNNYFREGLIYVKRSNHVKFLLLWLIYDFIAVLWVKDYISWAKSIFFIGLGLLSTVIFCIYVREKKDFMRCFLAIELSSLVFNFFGWYEVITRKYLFYKDIYFLDLIKISGKRIPIFICGNENEFALVSLFCVFISYICLKNKTGHLGRLISQMMIISNIILIYFSGSRGIFIALIIGGICMIWLNNKIIRKSSNKMIFMCFCIILSFCILMIVFTFLSQDRITLNFEQGSSDSFRLNLIKEGFKFLYETMLVGVGGGNIEFWMQNYSNLGLASIHNWWVEVLVSFGPLIFVLYVCFYLSLYFKMYKLVKIKNDVFSTSVAIAIFSYLSCFIIACMVSSSMLKNEWTWVLWGLIIAFNRYSIKNQSSIFKNKNASKGDVLSETEVVTENQ